jgi:hypothetical protein
MRHRWIPRRIHNAAVLPVQARHVDGGEQSQHAATPQPLEALPHGPAVLADGLAAAIGLTKMNPARNSGTDASRELAKILKIRSDAA